jgi:hypothetical protein
VLKVLKGHRDQEVKKDTPVLKVSQVKEVRLVHKVLLE